MPAGRGTASQGALGDLGPPHVPCGTGVRETWLHYARLHYARIHCARLSPPCHPPRRGQQPRASSLRRGPARCGGGPARGSGGPARGSGDPARGSGDPARCGGGQLAAAGTQLAAAEISSRWTRRCRSARSRRTPARPSRSRPPWRGRAPPRTPLRARAAWPVGVGVDRAVALERFADLHVHLGRVADGVVVEPAQLGDRARLEHAPQLPAHEARGGLQGALAGPLIRRRAHHRVVDLGGRQVAGELHAGHRGEGDPRVVELELQAVGHPLADASFEPGDGARIGQGGLRLARGGDRGP
jgi:hypothetical protein